MFPGRVAAVVRGLKSTNRSKKQELAEKELKLLKVQNPKRFQDPDLYEVSKTVMRFRNYPYAFWFLGFGFLLGAIFVVTLLFEDFIQFKKLWHEYALVAGMVALGMLFLTSGKIKSVIFDKEAKQVIIRKRTITCHCKTITKFDLKDLYDVRAVWRGIHTQQMNTLHYAIILDFDVDQMLRREAQIKKEARRSQQASTEETEDDENAYLTSDAEQEMVHFAVNDEQYNEFLRNKKQEEESKGSEQEQTEVTEADAPAPPEQLQVKKRKYTWSKLFQSCLPMWNHQVKNGCKFEVKILETKDRQTILKKVIMIRRFLKMPVEDCDVKIHDERSTNRKLDPDDFSKKSIDEHFERQDEKEKRNAQKK